MRNEIIKPWYGKWPPKCRENNEMKKGKTWWEKWGISIFMASILVMGILLLLCSIHYLKESSTGRQLLDGLAIAVIIAGILGLTIDRLFRQQLAEDAFKASIGYILPDELKSEMEWIYGTQILCTQHIQTCKLTSIDDDICTLNVRMYRTFKNISHTRGKIIFNIGIDEWFHKEGSSQILCCGYSTGKEEWEQKEDFRKTECGWEVGDAPEIWLAPDEEITTWCEVKEITRTNDANFWGFGYPTRNPIVTVEAYEGIRIRVRFGYRITPEKLGQSTYRLSGTLLPMQRIEIRWWREADSEKWMEHAENTKKPTETNSEES